MEQNQQPQEFVSVKKMRQDAGLSQTELAAITGIPLGRISKWELRGSVPNALDYEKVVKATTDKTIVPKNEIDVVRNPLLRTVPGHGEEEINVHNIDFAASNSVIFFEDNQETPAYTMKIPQFSGCIAFYVYGDSMEGLIKGGSMVFGRKLENWRRYLEYGQIYGIVMNDNQRYLKYIRRSNEDPKKCFLLKSENARYDDFEIPKEDIHNIWLIEGWMLKRT